MTADNKFAARLRELSRLASAGPWGIKDIPAATIAWSQYSMAPTKPASLSYVIEGFRGGTYIAQSVACNDGEVPLSPSRVESGATPPHAPLSNANADLIVALRNHADRLADLVERVEDVVRAWDLCQPTQAVVDAMRTALDSLNGGGA